MKSKILFIVIFVLSISPCFAQTSKNRRLKSKRVKTVNASSQPTLSDEEKKQQVKLEQMDKEASYYAPIRYVIVYNYIFDGGIVPERRMKILMQSNQLTEKNLIKVFDLIKKRFPTPMRLMIIVYTSLATIETPEEDEMLPDSRNSRFSHTYGKYKKAFYIRYETGEEAFNFDYGKPREFHNKWVRLPKSQQPQKEEN